MIKTLIIIFVISTILSVLIVLGGNFIVGLKYKDEYDDYMEHLKYKDKYDDKY